VADVLHKGVDDPDEVVHFPNVRVTIVRLGDLTAGRMSTRLWSVLPLVHPNA
jgi:hypothetical protein